MSILQKSSVRTLFDHAQDSDGHAHSNRELSRAEQLFEPVRSLLLSKHSREEGIARHIENQRETRTTPGACEEEDDKRRISSSPSSTPDYHSNRASSARCAVFPIIMMCAEVCASSKNKGQQNVCDRLRAGHCWAGVLVYLSIRFLLPAGAFFRASRVRKRRKKALCVAAPRGRGHSVLRLLVPLLLVNAWPSEARVWLL